MTIISPGSTLTVRLADASYEVVVPEVRVRGEPALLLLIIGTVFVIIIIIIIIIIFIIMNIL